MWTTPKALLAAAVIALTGAVGVPQQATAQSSGNESQQAQPKTDWSDQKLKSFVQAAMEVRGVYKQWKPKIEQAETKEDRKKMRKQANSAAIEKVKASSLTVKEYTAINRAMRKDPEFFEKVKGMMQKAQQ